MIKNTIFRFLIIAVAFMTTSVGVYGEDENVVIRDRTVNYRLKADKGILKTIKMEDVANYEALRADGAALPVAFYGNSITIDKAQAPGATAIYRSWEDDDIFFSGSRVCALPMPLKKGKPAKAVFEKTYNDPAQFCQVMLGSAYPTEKLTYNIFVPAELAGRIVLTPMNLPDGVGMTRTDSPKGDAVYTVTLTGVKPFKREPLAPGADEIGPQIVITGYFDGIKGVYDYLRSFVDESESSEAVSSLARDLCKNAGSDIARIDSIAAWVRQNIRYVAVEHGEYGLKPDRAENVLSNRFGDCKGTANLIRVMLNAVGIDGRLGWIGTRGGIPAPWSQNASLCAGNHQIAVAALPDTLVFIDGTTTYASDGYIPSSIEGQECLILNGDEPRIEIVPRNADNTNIDIMTADVTASTEGVKGHFTRQFGGADRMAVENTLSKINASRRNSALQLIAANDRKSVRIDSLTLSTTAPNAPRTIMEYVETDPSAVRAVSSGKTYVMLRPFGIFSYSPVDAKARRMPLRMSRPETIETHISCSLPDGMTVDKLPERAEIASPGFEGFAEYTLSPDGTTVTCDAMLRVLATDIPADKVGEWNDAVRRITSVSNNPIVLIPVSHED